MIKVKKGKIGNAWPHANLGKMKMWRKWGVMYFDDPTRGQWQWENEKRWEDYIGVIPQTPQEKIVIMRWHQEWLNQG